MPEETTGEGTNTEGEGATGAAKATTEAGKPATSAGDTGAGGKQTTQASATEDDVKQFSQNQVSAFVGDARVKARETAVASALSELGLTDMDALKAVLKSHNDSERAKLSELEAVQADLAGLKEADTRATDTEATNKKLLKVIEIQTAALMKSLNIPEHVKPLIEAMPIVDRLAYLTENGENFAVEESKKKPEINSGGKGSNGDTSKNSAMAKIKSRYHIN